MESAQPTTTTMTMATITILIIAISVASCRAGGRGALHRAQGIGKPQDCAGRYLLFMNMRN